MFRGPSSVDKSENPDLEEAAINQERMADLEIEREDVKGQRHNTTETALAASFVSSHYYDLAIVSIIHQFNTHIPTLNMP